jgi:hypothetical protein
MFRGQPDHSSTVVKLSLEGVTPGYLLKRNGGNGLSIIAVGIDDVEELLPLGLFSGGGLQVVLGLD